MLLKKLLWKQTYTEVYSKSSFRVLSLLDLCEEVVYGWWKYCCNAPTNSYFNLLYPPQYLSYLHMRLHSHYVQRSSLERSHWLLFTGHMRPASWTVILCVLRSLWNVGLWLMDHLASWLLIVFLFRNWKVKNTWIIQGEGMSMNNILKSRSIISVHDTSYTEIF